MTRRYIEALRKVIEMLAGTLSDEEAMDAPDLFPHWNPSAHYEDGDRDITHRQTGIPRMPLLCLRRFCRGRKGQKSVSGDSLTARTHMPSVREFITTASCGNLSIPITVGSRVCLDGRWWSNGTAILL